MTTKTTLGLLVALGLVACAAPATTDWGKTSDDSQYTSAEETAPPVRTIDPVRVIGSVNYRNVPPQTESVMSSDPLFAAKRRAKIDQLTQRTPSAQPLPSAPPTVTPSKVSTAVDGALYGFPGISAQQMDTATSTQGITPPDQALCAGNGFVVEAVNSALAVYDILGQPVSNPVDIASFFKFPAPANGVSQFASDPKCYYDQATGRFFATILALPSDATGNILGSKLRIAVSASSDPRDTWNIFEIELADDGTNGSPNHPHCPCLGDQPLIGADTNGFYVTTNEFGLSTTSPGFNGAQIYAFSKKSLVSGRLPSVVHLANLVLANGIGFSIQPAFSPSGTGASDANGTEYFLSSLDFNGSLDNRIALWGLSNTASLDSATPAVKLEHVVLQSEAYGFPPPALQKDGPAPLRDCLNAGNCPGTTAKASAPNAGVQQVDTNDDRMNQAVLAGGSLWAGLNTVVTVGGQQRGGIAWFQAEPKRLGSGKLGARVKSQGYVAVAHNDVLFPSIALTDDGRGAMTFAISGSDYYPSAAYVRLGSKGFGDVRIAGAGAAPLDDWDGYDPFGPSGGPVRYGDYSAALVDGDTLWMATENVPVSCTTLPCAGRDTFTNWGTFVSRIDLSDTLDQ